MPTSYMKSYGLEADQIQAAAGDPSVVSNPESPSQIVVRVSSRDASSSKCKTSPWRANFRP